MKYNMQKPFRLVSARTITQDSDTHISASRLVESYTPLVDHFIGGYRLVHAIDSTKRSVIYLGQHDNKSRAFKFSTLAQDDTTHTLRDEFEIGRSVDSPHVVSFYSYGTYRGLSYIKMELLSARNLADAAMGEPNNLEVLLRLFRTTLEGVGDIHKNGIVHLDLKPGNIMLDCSGLVKIIDFSHSVRTDPKGLIWVEHVTLGTPGYMAPEVFDGNFDKRTDIFSTACAMFAALTGNDPFGACRESSESRIFLSRDRTPAHLGIKRPDLPGILVDAIMHALSKDPDKRFQTAKEFEEAIIACAKKYNISI